MDRRPDSGTGDTGPATVMHCTGRQSWATRSFNRIDYSAELDFDFIRFAAVSGLSATHRYSLLVVDF